MNSRISSLGTKWTQTRCRFHSKSGISLNLISESKPCSLSSSLSTRRHRFLSTSNPRSTCNSAPQSRHVLDILSERSLLQSVTSRALRQHLRKDSDRDGEGEGERGNGSGSGSGSESGSESGSGNRVQHSTRRTIYAGVDPSAPSLHVGNLLPLMALLWLAKHGHRVIVVIGGATGSIGDPSGRSTERSALSPEQLKRNVDSITNQVFDFFKSASEHEKRRNGGQDINYDINVVNNQEWYQGMNVLDFLGKVGRHARVGVMMARDSVKSRLFPSETSTSASATNQPVGLSFTEFSYQLLQAYDFYRLNISPEWNCTVQVGGSDQLGNISAGIDLIRRIKASESTSSSQSSKITNLDEDFSQDDSSTSQEESMASTSRTGAFAFSTEAYGLTLPLLTNSNGSKFGKSAGNAVWLDRNLLSDYDFFQFFRKCNDKDLILYLKTLTFLDIEEISFLENQLSTPSKEEGGYKKNSGQLRLAEEITELVRGLKGLENAKLQTRIFFDTNVEDLELKDIEESFQDDERLKRGFKREDLIGVEVTKVMNMIGGTKSRGDARRLLQSNGLFLNSVPLKEDRPLSEEDLLKGRFFILRSGKAGHHLVLLDE